MKSSLFWVDDQATDIEFEIILALYVYRWMDFLTNDSDWEQWRI